MATTTFADDVVISGTARILGGLLPSVPRTSLTQDDLRAYPVQLNDARVWDAFGTVLPTTGATDDLGLYTGTFGTGCPYIATGDLKNAGATSRYARFLLQIPAEYVTGESVTIRASAGMLTTVASTTATIDVEAYLVARDTTKSGSDLVSTSATSINSLTFANKDFVLTTSTLTPGALIDVRITIAVNDSGTGTAVTGALGALDLLCDVQG